MVTGVKFSRENFSDVKWGPLTIRFYPGLEAIKGGRALWHNSARPSGVNSSFPDGNVEARVQHVKHLIEQSYATGEKIDPKELSGDVDEPVVIGHFRGGVADYVRNFQAGFRSSVTIPSSTKYVIESGMGANRMWTDGVAVASNADPNRKAEIRVATTSQSFETDRGLHPIETIPADAKPEEIFWIFKSRSGKTAETLITAETANERGLFRSGLVYANGDRLMALAKGIPGAKIMPFSEKVSIPGRYMRAKTEVLMATMAAACSDEFFNRYWAAAAEADASLHPVGKNEIHLDFVRFTNMFFNARNPEGSSSIYLCGNHPANVLVNKAWLQLHNEGAGKPGYTMVAFQGTGMPDEAHWNIEQLFNLAKMGFAMGIFSYDISNDPIEQMLRNSVNPKFNGLTARRGINALNQPNVDNWADAGPCIRITYNGITPEVLAYMHVLGENYFADDLAFNEICAGSNPKVRAVRVAGGPALEAAAAAGRKEAGIEA